jgi:CRP-like cAMP-binding protein
LGEYMLDTTDISREELLNFIESHYSGPSRRFEKGRILLWQGDKVNFIYAITKGTVKIFSISDNGKIYTYGLVGKGGLIGGPESLAETRAKVMVEAIKDTDVIVISPDDFQRLLSSHPQFSFVVAKKLARDLIYISDKAKSLGFFDVQKRLKDALINLAVDHGIKTDKGIRITLNITHKDIGELIGANRTTITYFINELKRQGYLSKEGKHWVIVPPEDADNSDYFESALVNEEEEIILKS